MELIESVWNLLSDPRLMAALTRSESPPLWLTSAVQPALAICALIAVGVAAFATATSGITRVRGWVKRQHQTPLDRARQERLHAFAEYLLARLDRMQEHQGFRTDRFVDLESDYYQGLDSAGSLWSRLIGPGGLGAQRRKALTHALINGRDKFVLLEGDPGSGKSVVLQETARRLCKRAAAARSLDATIGLYLNLKMLDRRPDQKVDEALVRNFVLDQLTLNVSDEKRRLFAEDFERGMSEGRWFFLFDSFDEIPDVLSSEDISGTIQHYADAIIAFATGLGNRSRTVLATRYFRRPQQSTLPHYRVLPLSDRQRDTLIERAKLLPEASARLYNAISSADGSTQYIVENPMYLELLIEFVRGGGTASPTPHALFDYYVNDLFRRHANQLRDTFHTDATSLHHFAETIAFAIVSNPALGLNPWRKTLLASIGRSDPGAGLMLDALVSLLLARGNEDDEADEQRRFTFSHRRFQEYFATSLVLRSPDAVPETDLLFEPRWRETTAVLLTAAAGPKTDATLALIATELAQASDALRSLHMHCDEWSEDGEQPLPDFFPWPPHTLQLLGLLKDGFADNAERLPDRVRRDASDILSSGFLFGRLSDKRLSLELSAIVEPPRLIAMLRKAITYGSQLLDDVAFRLIRRLPSLPDDLARWIRFTLAERAYRGELQRQRRTLLAFMSRVRDNERLYNVTRLLCRISLIDLSLHTLLLVALVVGELDAAMRIGLVGAIAASAAVRPLLWRVFSSLPAVPTIRPNQANPIPFHLLRIYIPAGYLVVIRFGVPGIFLILEIPWLVAVSFPMATWAGMAMLAGINGRFTARPWWPFLSLYPLLALVVTPVASLGRVARHLKSFGWWYIAYGVAAVLFFFAMDTIERDYPRAGGWAVTLYFFAAALVGAVFVYSWFSDRLRFRRALALQGTMAVPDFFSELAAYRLGSGRVRFVRQITERMPLPANNDSLQLVRNVNRHIERLIHASQRTTQPPSPRLGLLTRETLPVATLTENQTGLPALDQWLHRQRRWLAFRGRPLLDELMRLEQRLAELQPPVLEQNSTSAAEKTTLPPAVDGRDSPASVELMTCFISYTKSDKDWAVWIAWTLEKVGFRAIVQEWDFRPGQNFVLEMRRALKSADAVVAVLSPEYLRSSFASVEWASAYAADPVGQTRKLIPVRVADCEPGDLLGQIVYVDLLDLSPAAAERKLIDAFAPRRKPAVAPPFPLQSHAVAVAGVATTTAVRPTYPGKANEQ